MQNREEYFYNSTFLMKSFIPQKKVEVKNCT